MGKYYHTKESVQEYIKLAQGYDGSDAIQELRKILAPGSAVLEIGSGPGTDWNNLNEDYRVTGSDNSAEFLKHLQSSYPKGDFLLLDAATINTVKNFDAIYSNKVLHHLDNKALEASITRQWEILKPGGLICHTFWKGEGAETYNGLFVNYHSQDGLRANFGYHFKPLLIQSYKEFEQDDSILFIGKRKK